MDQSIEVSNSYHPLGLVHAGTGKKLRWLSVNQPLAAEFLRSPVTLKDGTAKRNNLAEEVSVLK